MRARASGSMSACTANLKNQGTALEMYATDYDGLYPSSLHALSPDYLRRLPTCPSTDLEYGYVVSKKPFILGMDTPSIDYVDNEQGLWPLIYGNGIYIVAPLVNIENISKFKVKLYVCPLNILNTTGLPCRVIIVEE